MKKKLIALVLALSLLTSCLPGAMADFLPTLPPDASVTVAPQVTAAPEEAAEPEEPAPSASVTVTTESDFDFSSLRGGIKVWIGMNGSLYVKNTTRNYMKYLQMFYRADGGEATPLGETFSLGSGQTKKVCSPEEVQAFMTGNDVKSVEFLALQSATKGEADFIAASEICVFAPETVYAVIENMPVYKSDNTGSGRLYSVDAGTALLMLNSRDEWVRVYTEQGIGYTRIKYLALAEGLPSIVTEKTFIYAEATMNSKRTEIAEGTVVYLVGKSGKFYLIRDAAGEYSYILKKYLAEYDGEVPAAAVSGDAAEAPSLSGTAEEFAPAEEPAASVAPGSVPSGFAYADAESGLSFYLSEGEWIHQKDETTGQLYLQETGGAADDLISVSYQILPQGAQFASLHQQAWANISSSLTASGISISALTEESRAIGPDGQYNCHVYRMTLTASGVDFHCAYAFWCTETKLYVCSLSATMANGDKMFAALDELLGTFAPVE